MSGGDSERARLDAVASAAARRAARETTQHLDGTVHLQTTSSLSPGALASFAGLLVTIFAGMAGIYATGRSTDSAHEQRLLALEKSEETRRQIAASDRAELIAELRGLRRELQEAIERLNARIERKNP